MDIKIPRFRIIRPQHASLVAEEIIILILKYSFWFFIPGVLVFPFGCWKIYDLIKPLIEGIN